MPKTWDPSGHHIARGMMMMMMITNQELTIMRTQCIATHLSKQRKRKHHLAKVPLSFSGPPCPLLVSVTSTAFHLWQGVTLGMSQCLQAISGRWSNIRSSPGTYTRLSHMTQTTGCPVGARLAQTGGSQKEKNESEPSFLEMRSPMNVVY